MTDKARDEAFKKWWRPRKPEEEVQHYAHRKGGAGVTWDYLWPKWRKSEADADRIATLVIQAADKDEHIRKARENLALAHGNDLAAMSVLERAAFRELEQALKEQP